MKTKISLQGRVSLWLIIILMIAAGLGVGGFFVWRYFSGSKISFPGVKKEEVEIYKGIWMPGMAEGWLAANIQEMKDLGIDTISLAIMVIQEEGNPLAGLDTSHILEDIQLAHENGMKVILNPNIYPKPKLEEKDLEALSSLTIEAAKLAEK